MWTTHMHAVTITHLSRSPGLNFLPQDLLQSIYSHFMSTHLRTQPCASCHLDLHKKHSRWKHKHAKLKHFFSPIITRSLVGDLLYPHPLHWDQWMQKQSTLYKEREWVVQKVEGGNKGRQLWGLALHAVSSPFGTIIIRIRLAVVTGGGHLLTLLT